MSPSSECIRRDDDDVLPREVRQPSPLASPVQEWAGAMEEWAGGRGHKRGGKRGRRRERERVGGEGRGREDPKE